MRSKFCLSILGCLFFSFQQLYADDRNIADVKWDSRSLIIDGKRVVPVMGEVHYSRIPFGEWQQEVRKMKDGGVTVIATYVFWNHIEEQEGIFNWSGQRNLRRFIEICQEENLPVVLRVGPFCHGEVRNGGIPDWMFQKGCKLRQPNAKLSHSVSKVSRFPRRSSTTSTKYFSFGAG